MLDILLLGIVNMAAATVGGAAIKRRSSQVDRKVAEGYDYDQIAPTSPPSFLDRLPLKKKESDPKKLLETLAKLEPATLSQNAIDVGVAKKNKKSAVSEIFKQISVRILPKKKEPSSQQPESKPPAGPLPEPQETEEPESVNEVPIDELIATEHTDEIGPEIDKYDEENQASVQAIDLDNTPQSSEEQLEPEPENSSDQPEEDSLETDLVNEQPSEETALNNEDAPVSEINELPKIAEDPDRLEGNQVETEIRAELEVETSSEQPDHDTSNPEHLNSEIEEPASDQEESLQETVAEKSDSSTDPPEVFGTRSEISPEDPTSENNADDEVSSTAQEEDDDGLLERDSELKTELRQSLQLEEKPIESDSVSVSTESETDQQETKPEAEISVDIDLQTESDENVGEEKSEPLSERTPAETEAELTVESVSVEVEVQADEPADLVVANNVEEDSAVADIGVEANEQPQEEDHLAMSCELVDDFFSESVPDGQYCPLAAKGDYLEQIAQIELTIRNLIEDEDSCDPEDVETSATKLQDANDNWLEFHQTIQDLLQDDKMIVQHGALCKRAETDLQNLKNGIHGCQRHVAELLGDDAFSAHPDMQRQTLIDLRQQIMDVATMSHRLQDGLRHVVPDSTFPAISQNHLTKFDHYHEGLEGLQSVFLKFKSHPEFEGQPAEIGLVEIQGVQEINAKHGIVYGDQFLDHCNETIYNSVRHNRDFDRVVRISGNQFAIFFGMATNHAAKFALERIRQNFEAINFEIHQQPMKVQCCCSTMSWDPNQGSGHHFQTLLAAVEKGIENGGNRVMIFDKDQKIQQACQLPNYESTPQSITIDAPNTVAS